MRPFWRRKRTHGFALVELPDGGIERIQLLAPTVWQHNRVADRLNAIIEKTRATKPNEENPLTQKEIGFALRHLEPEGDWWYGHNHDDGWGFYTD